MSFLGNILSFFKKFSLSAPPIHNKVLSTQLFSPLDLEKIKKELKLNEKGIERGKNEFPPSSALTFDDVEQSIISTILDEKKFIHEKVIDDLNVYEFRLNQNEIPRLKIELNNLSANFKNQIEKEVKIGEDIISSGKENIKEIKKFLQKFKEKNKLDRIARYPESRIWNYSILVFLILVETIINSIFFKEGDEFGFLGGMGKAFIVSGINVFLGFFFGSKILPKKNYVLLKKNFWAYILLPVYAALAISFNFLVAHYRVALSGINPEIASKIAIVNLLNNPFQFNDVNAVFLLIIGFLISIVSVIDGYKIDDPYPEYGSWDRKLNECKEDYLNDKKILYDSIENLKEKTLNDIDNVFHDINLQASEVQTVKANRRQLVSKYNEHTSYLINCCNSLLEYYRHFVKSNRKSPPPKYFDNKFNLEYFNDSIDLTVLESNDPKIFDFENLEEEARCEKENVNTIFQYALNRFKQLEEL